MNELRHFLVTGGLGSIGAPLVRAQLHKGHRVRVLDDCSRGRPDRLQALGEDIEIVNGDVRDRECVERALAGIDCVIHLAAINGTRNFYERPVDVLEVAVKGILNVLDGCIAAGVGELFIASSSEVYQSPPAVPTDETVPLVVPDPFNPRYSYGAGKLISEVLAINYGRQHFDRVVIFRPHNVYGPDMGADHVIPQFILRLDGLMGKQGTSRPITFPIQGSGEETRSFVYIDDFIAALMLVLERGEHHNIYNIGTTDEISVHDLAHRIAAIMGAEISLALGLEALGATGRRCPDIGKLETLGFRPRVPLDRGLELTVDWYHHAANYRS